MRLVPNGARCLALAISFLPAPCAAEVLAQLGAAPALPGGSGEVTRFSAGLKLGAGFRFTDSFAAGVMVFRFHEDGLERALTSALIYARSDFLDKERLRLFATAELGPSVFTGCTAAFACDAWGAMVALGIGLSATLSKHVEFHVALEPTAQLGMPGQTSWLFMPTLVAGVALWGERAPSK